MSRLSPIQTDDISVVVQGPVMGKPGDPSEKRLTAECLRRLRKHLPGCEIILSTWEGTDCSDLEYDVLLLNSDPGNTPLAVGFTRLDRMNNTNRLLVSAQKGLAKASRPYCLKIRSDLWLEGNDWLRFFYLFPHRHPEWQISKQRILIPTMFTFHPDYQDGKIFHPSDWFSFGLTEDVRRLLGAPWVSTEEANWYATHLRPLYCHIPSFISRYVCEQQIWFNYLKSHAPVYFENQSHTTVELRHISKLSFANNLVILDSRQLQFRFAKYEDLSSAWAWTYSFQDWLSDYRRYCDPKFKRIFYWDWDSVQKSFLRWVFPNTYWQFRLGERLRKKVEAQSATRTNFSKVYLYLIDTVQTEVSKVQTVATLVSLYTTVMNWEEIRLVLDIQSNIDILPDLKAFAPAGAIIDISKPDILQTPAQRWETARTHFLSITADESPETWFILAAPNALWQKGWVDALHGQQQFQFLTQTWGSLVLAMTRQMTCDVGDFDLQFPEMAYCSADYILRALLEQPEAVSINETQIPKHLPGQEVLSSQRSWQPIGPLLTDYRRIWPFSEETWRHLQPLSPKSQHLEALFCQKWRLKNWGQAGCKMHFLRSRRPLQWLRWALRNLRHEPPISRPSYLAYLLSKNL